MARLYYYVASQGDNWIVYPESRIWQRVYPTKDKAVDAATREAKEEHDLTRKLTGVRIKRADGTFQEERSYGNDPYPPRG